MNPRKPEIIIIGPCATHDQACAVLHGDGEPAVLDLTQGIFKPSRKAQKMGFHLVKADTKFKLWLVRTFFGVKAREQ